MIYYMGHKVTATEVAKLMIEDCGSRAVEFWGEDESLAHGLLTEKEKVAIDEALTKHMARVRKLLGFWELRDKVFAREDHSLKIAKKRGGYGW